MPTLEERLTAVEDVLIAQGLMPPRPEPIPEPEIQQHYSPQQLRDRGVAYCPECYTFGSTHRKDCRLRLTGMTRHITNKVA